MKKTLAIWLLFVVVAGGGTALLSLGRTRPNNRDDTQPTSAIKMQRLRPNATDDVVHVPSASGPVEFVYELSNSGTTSLTELRAQLFCQCAVTQKLPETIAPGQTVQFGFRFPAPQAGFRNERVVVTSNDSQKPLAVMNARVYADVTVPHLVIAPDVVQVRVIRGQPLIHDFLISVIERAGSEHLIQTPAIAPNVGIVPDIQNVQETAEYDAANVRRVYLLQLRAEAAQVTRDFDGLLRLAEENGSSFSQIPVKVEVLETVTLIPKSFDFRPPDVATSQSRFVNVVRRGNVAGGAVKVKEFDHELVDVRSASSDGSRVQRYEVIPKASPKELRETQVVFEADADDGGTQELVLLVRLFPE